MKKLAAVTMIGLALSAGVASADPMIPAERAGIRGVAADSVVGVVTLLTTWSPTATTWAATTACAFAGTEEAAAAILE